MNTSRKQKTLEMKANGTPYAILLHDTSHETLIVLKITEVKSCDGNTHSCSTLQRRQCNV